MWELLVGHLDQTLKEARVAAAERDDMMARRAALYRQAQAKADAEAARAMAEKFGTASAPQNSAPAAAPATQDAAPKQQ